MGNAKVGEAIKTARKKAGLTQEELASKLDIAGCTLHQYESGKRTPTIEMLKKISDTIDISFSGLLLALVENELYFDSHKQRIFQMAFDLHSIIENEKEFDSLIDTQKCNILGRLDAVETIISKEPILNFEYQLWLWHERG